MTVRIGYGGLVIRAYPGMDGVDRGLFLAKDGFEGWEDAGAEFQASYTDRPNAHGAFEADALLRTRQPSITAWALADSDRELGLLRQRVSGAGADGGLHPFTVDMHEATTWANAQRSGRWRFTDQGVRNGVLRASVFMQFACPDPRIYGAAQVFAAGEPAFHRGNFPADPKVTVTGTFPGGYSVHGPRGHVFSVAAPLVPGNTDVIDMRTGWVYRNGALLVGGVARADVSQVLPGASSDQVFLLVAPSGSGSMLVSVTDTFV